MPEGPEIRRIADRLEKVLVGQPLERVWFAKPAAQDFAGELGGSSVVEIRTKGKALLTVFEAGLTVYSHNQLYGRWYIVPINAEPNTNRSLRWVMETAKHRALLYSASDIEVMDSDALAEHPFLVRAGLDILSDRPDVTELSTYMAQAKFSRRTLGALLLDQSFVAGIGNYLRSDILFAARIHPSAKLGSMNGHQRRRLAAKAIAITRRAYETGGITNEPEKVNSLKKQGWSRSRYRHYVFAREGEHCHACAAIIEKVLISGRRLYLCPQCQQP